MILAVGFVWFWNISNGASYPLHWSASIHSLPGFKRRQHQGNGAILVSPFALGYGMGAGHNIDVYAGVHFECRWTEFDIKASISTLRSLSHKLHYVTLRRFWCYQVQSHVRLDHHYFLGRILSVSGRLNFTLLQRMQLDGEGFDVSCPRLLSCQEVPLHRENPNSELFLEITALCYR